MYAGGDPVNAIDPTGRQTAVLGSPATEYGDIILNVSLATIAGVDALACAINIQLAMDALRVDGYDYVYPSGFCSAKERRKCSCQASCYCHQIGSPNHSGIGPFPGSGTGASCKEAKNAAKKDAGLSCAPGWHAQHCDYSCPQ